MERICFSFSLLVIRKKYIFQPNSESNNKIGFPKLAPFEDLFLL